MMNLHGARVNTDILKPHGSSFTGSHGEDFLVANDPNFRAIQLRTGPDGSIFMTDWYDPQICHNPDPNIWDRDTGRIYKVVYKGTKPVVPGDLSKRTSDQLVEMLKDKNSWWWRQALLILAERGDQSVAPKLKEMVRKSQDHRHALRALWALNDIGGFDQALGRELLGHDNEWVRAWAVRCLGQLDATIEDQTFNKLDAMVGARHEKSPAVRLQLASAMQRMRRHLSPHYSEVLLEDLMEYDQDAKDPAIPLMIWFAYEPLVPTWQKEILNWISLQADKHVIVRDTILPRVVRRLAASGLPADLDAALHFLKKLNPPSMSVALDGLLEQLRGRRLEPTAGWKEETAFLFGQADRGVQERARRLGLHFGHPESIQWALDTAQQESPDLGRRIQAIQGLALARAENSVPTLIRLATGKEPAELRREALRALASFGKPEVATSLLASWSRLPTDMRTDTVGMLCGRRSWASALVDALKKGTLTKQDLSENDVRRILALHDEELTKKLELVWGKMRERTPAKIEEQIAKLRGQLAEHPGDRQAGRAVFEKNCMVCHKLRGEGHEVGPDLTGANRRDLEYLLINIIDPNRVVGRDYYTATVVDKSGRSLSGLLAEDTAQRVVLKGENAKLTIIPRNEIDAFQIEERSLMPEGLPEKMSEKDFRDLIAYLMEDPYLTRGLITGPYKMALDGKGPIEEASDPLKTPGVTWRPFEVGLSGLMDMEKLKTLAPPTDSTGYLYFEVVSPKAVKSAIELAAKEDVKIWLNGKEIHRRTWSVEPHRVPVELKEGTNKLLFKLHNIYGPSWMWARVIDPDRSLEVKALKAP
jgi:putative heme-binding domain-containing protein